MESLFLFDFLKSFIVLAGIVVILGLLCLIVLYYIESRNIRDDYSHYSTSMGNALFLLQDIFEPQSKFRTEQVIWVKKRRTPAEKKVLGLSELGYDKIIIRGIRSMKSKRYYLKS